MKKIKETKRFIYYVDKWGRKWITIKKGTPQTFPKTNKQNKQIKTEAI